MNRKQKQILKERYDKAKNEQKYAVLWFIIVFAVVSASNFFWNCNEYGNDFCQIYLRAGDWFFIIIVWVYLGWRYYSNSKKLEDLEYKLAGR